MKRILKEKWLFLLIVLQPFLDMIAYFQYDSAVGTMAGYLRLVILLLVPFAVLNKKRKLSFVILMGIIGLYCVLHMAGCYLNGYQNIVADLSYMMKVVQMPILGISFCYILNEEAYREQIVRGFVVNYIVIVISMVVAHLSGTALYTYNDYKIGYLGWFGNANSQSIILISISTFVIYYAVKKKSKVGVPLAMIGVAIVLLSNGTKAGYLALLGIYAGLTAFYAFDWFMAEKGKRKLQPVMIAFSVILIVTSVLAYPITPRYAMDIYSYGKREEENKVIEEEKEKISTTEKGDVLTLDDILADPKLKQELIEIYEEDLNQDLVEKFGVERVLAEYGWAPGAYELADVRLQKRINAKLVWEESNFITHLFGVEFTEMEDYDLENDYPAIFYYYGYVGFGLYMIFLAYFLVLIIKVLCKRFKEAFCLFNFMLALTYVLQLGLAQFSGAILRRPNASIYLALVVAMIYYQCKKIEKG